MGALSTSGVGTTTDSTDSPFLVQVKPASSKGWTLNKDRMTIGRDQASDVYLEDPYPSERHAYFAHQGTGWAIIDAGSANGTFVNQDKVKEADLREGDHIRIGNTELVVRMPAGDQSSPAITYDVGSQTGNVSNIGGNQTNYLTESNLRYIASRRGRARALIVWGIVLFVVGQALGLEAVLSFQGSIFNVIDSQSFQQPDIPNWFFPAFGSGAFLTLIGLTLFIFGLIARGGAKREARRLGADWQ